MNRSKKTAAVLAGATVAVAGLGTAAYAYWSTSGSGTGSAGTGDAVAVTVTQTSTVSGLVPGGAAKDVAIKVANTQSTAQYVGGVTFAISSIKKGTADATGCSASDFALVQPTWSGHEIAGTSDETATGTIAMRNTSSNQDGCKGVTVSFSLTASAAATPAA